MLPSGKVLLEIFPIAETRRPIRRSFYVGSFRVGPFQIINRVGNMALLYSWGGELLVIDSPRTSPLGAWDIKSHHSSLKNGQSELI